jgi:hypothetical protein
MENILLYVVLGAIVLAVVLGWNKEKTSTATKPGPRPTPKTVDNVAPNKADLQKLTKKQIDDTAAAQGVKLDARETKAKMIDAFIKQAK